MLQGSAPGQVPVQWLAILSLWQRFVVRIRQKMDKKNAKKEPSAHSAIVPILLSFVLYFFHLNDILYASRFSFIVQGLCALVQCKSGGIPRRSDRTRQPWLSHRAHGAACSFLFSLAAPSNSNTSTSSSWYEG